MSTFTRSNSRQLSAPVIEMLESRTLLSAVTIPLAAGKAQFTDADGDTVKIVLAGGGSGSISFDQALPADAASLDVQADSPACTLTITVTGKHKSTTIASIAVDGELKSFKAPAVSLGKELDMDASALTTLTLADVLNSAKIDLAGGGPAVANLTLGHIGNGVDITGQDVAMRLTAADWASGLMSFRYATQISIAGDMGAMISAGSADAKGVSVGSISVGGVFTGDLAAPGSIGSLTAQSLLDGDIIIDSLGSLKTTGLKANVRKGIESDPGDVGSSLQLVGANVQPGKNVLGSAKIVGDLTVDAWINGNTGPVSIRNLRASLDIAGTGNVKVADGLSLATPLGGDIGSLSLGGGGKITSGSETLNLTNSSRLFVTGPDVYQTIALADAIFRDNTATFQAKSNLFPNPGLAVNITGVTQAVGNSAITTYSALGHTGYSMTWANNGGQIEQRHWFLQTQGVAMEFNFAGGLSLPSSLKLKQKYTDTSVVTGTLGFEFENSNPVDADITSGMATATTTILGHEEVSVPAGNYLAVKVQYDVTVTGNMGFEFQGDSYTGKFSMKSKTTVWVTPDDGVIKVVGSFTDGGTIFGAGSKSEKGSILVEKT